MGVWFYLMYVSIMQSVGATVSFSNVRHYGGIVSCNGYSVPYEQVEHNKNEKNQSLIFFMRILTLISLGLKTFPHRSPQPIPFVVDCSTPDHG